MVVNAVLALLPVLLFLGVLVLMDSFKLARPAAIAAAMFWGLVAAFIGDAVYSLLQPLLPLSEAGYSRFVAPLAEETAKAAFIAYLILRRRVGFPVDAAQLGFAVGTGFAVVENVQYLQVLGGASVVLWAVRGLGTAMLHGGATAVFAMLSQTAAERHRDRPVLMFVPGWASAVLIHAAFNLLPFSPVAMTATLLLALPLIMLWVFQRSESATRDWVGAGLDVDLMLYEKFSTDDLAHTRFGRYLLELRTRFPGPVVADMLCLLRVELELSIQVKVILIARGEGLVIPVHPDAYRAVDEVRYLRASIGPTGLLAMAPVHVTSHRDDWHRYLLTGSDSAGSRLLRLLRFRT